jgi:hypothetical protein
MMQWNEIYKPHTQAFNLASATDPAQMEQARNLLDHLVETGASFHEAQPELRHLFEQPVAALAAHAP